MGGGQGTAGRAGWGRQFSLCPPWCPGCTGLHTCPSSHAVLVPSVRPLPSVVPGRASWLGWRTGLAAVPHRSPLFCFAPPPHGLLSSSWACMQSVSERAALLVRPERALPPLPPACINSLSWPGRVLPKPLSTVGGSWHTGGWGAGGAEGPWWLPGQASGGGGVHLSVGSPGPALQGWGWVTWMLLRPPWAPAFSLLTNWPERSEVTAQWGPPRAPLGPVGGPTPEFLGKVSGILALGG